MGDSIKLFLISEFTWTTEVQQWIEQKAWEDSTEAVVGLWGTADIPSVWHHVPADEVLRNLQTSSTSRQQ